MKTNNCSVVPIRAWTSSKSAWYCTDAAEKFSVAAKSREGESVVKELVEKASSRFSRRQRGSGVAEMIAASPDLLAIPGVGPRNLKKLVQKGIGGVAQLKQIYKDKVDCCFVFSSFLFLLNLIIR